MAQQMNGIMRGASGGISRLAAALGGGDLAEQQAQQKAMEQQSRIGLALSQMRAHDAQAGFDGAKTDALRSRPQIMRELIAANAGTDLPTVDAFQQKLRTGELVTDFHPQEVSRLTQALTRFAPLASNTGDIKADDWAKALGGFRNMDLGDQVLSGQRTAGAVGAAQAAVDAKPLYHADSTGAVLDLYGGKLDTSNPMAGSTITLRKEQAGAQKANAAQSYAAAGASNAHAGLFRAQTEGERAGGAAGAKAPTGYRWSGDGKTMEPIPGGPADPSTKGAKLNKPPTEGQAKALLFGARMAIADDALSRMADAGVVRPGGIKAVAETVGNIAGLGTDSMGGALADVAGTLTNFTQSQEQQQVEQAQRDFINAVLRRESGASISMGEFRNAAKQYFPQTGDDKTTREQKAANRRTAIAGMKAEFGEAMVPEFERIVAEGRPSSAAPPKKSPPREGGATGSWGDAGGGAWKIEKVN